MHRAKDSLPQFAAAGDFAVRSPLTSPCPAWKIQHLESVVARFAGPAELPDRPNRLGLTGVPQNVPPGSGSNSGISTEPTRSWPASRSALRKEVRCFCGLLGEQK